MGLKKKWKDRTEERLIGYLHKVEEITKSLFEKNGNIDLSKFDQQFDLAHILALIINNDFISTDDKYFRQFAADDIMPIQIQIENKKILKYWGKIYWFCTPTDHECNAELKDPFYGEFNLNDNGFEIEKMMFGDFDKSDLDGIQWVNEKIKWMYDI